MVVALALAHSTVQGCSHSISVDLRCYVTGAANAANGLAVGVGLRLQQFFDALLLVLTVATIRLSNACLHSASVLRPLNNLLLWHTGDLHRVLVVQAMMVYDAARF